MQHDSSPPSPSWKVLVFRVTDEDHQAEILRALRRADDLDVVALGTRSGGDWCVVIDCPTGVTQVVAHGIVNSIDPEATVRYISWLQVASTA